MADVKFSELSALTTPASADVLAIVDTDASTSKKITLDTLFGVVPVNIAVDDATDSSSGTTGSIQTDGGIGCAKAAYVGTSLTVGTDASIGDDLTLGSDAAVLNFGADSDVNLTHVADTALMLNSTIALRFRDAALGINSSVNGQLDIYADAELEITAPIVDIDASTSVNVSNDLKLDSDAAVLGFGVDNDVTLTHVADTGLLLNSTMQLQFNDSSQYISSTGVIMSIVATDEIDLSATAIDLNGTLNASGLVTVQTGIVPDASDGAYLGTSSLQFSDLFLADSAVVAFGDDGDVTLTHVPDTGLLLTDASGVGTTQLQFGDDATYIHQASDSNLSMVADGDITLQATDIKVGLASQDANIQALTDAFDMTLKQADGFEVARITDGGKAISGWTLVQTAKGGFGYRRQVIQQTIAAGDAVLTTAESGALIRIVGGAGAAQTITLPAVASDAEVGVWYEFMVTTALSGTDTCKIRCSGHAGSADGFHLWWHSADDNAFGHTAFSAGNDILTLPNSTPIGTRVIVTSVVGGSNEQWLARAEVNTVDIAVGTS